MSHIVCHCHSDTVIPKFPSKAFVQKRPSPESPWTSQISRVPMNAQDSRLGWLEVLHSTWQWFEILVDTEILKNLWLSDPQDLQNSRNSPMSGLKSMGFLLEFLAVPEPVRSKGYFRAGRAALELGGPESPWIAVVMAIDLRPWLGSVGSQDWNHRLNRYLLRSGCPLFLPLKESMVHLGCAKDGVLPRSFGDVWEGSWKRARAAQMISTPSVNHLLWFLRFQSRTCRSASASGALIACKTMTHSAGFSLNSGFSIFFEA